MLATLLLGLAFLVAGAVFVSGENPPDGLPNEDIGVVLLGLGAFFGGSFVCQLTAPNSSLSYRMTSAQWSVFCSLVGALLALFCSLELYELGHLAKEGVPTQGTVVKVETRVSRVRGIKLDSQYRIVEYEGGRISLAGSGRRGEAVDLLVSPDDASIASLGAQGDGVAELLRKRFGLVGTLILVGSGPILLFLAVVFFVRFLKGPAKAVETPVPASAHPVSCAKCSHPIVEGAAFCVHCGTKVTARKCVSCQAPMEDTHRFCKDCGSGQDVSSTAKEEQSVPCVVPAPVVKKRKPVETGKALLKLLIFAASFASGFLWYVMTEGNDSASSSPVSLVESAEHDSNFDL